MHMNHLQHELCPQYESFWQRAWPRMRAGDTESDLRVFRKDQDLRRGMTVIARLALDVTQRIRAFLDSMQALDPQQYYYPSTDIHLTVLRSYQRMNTERLP
jgi:hypothetical protein